MRKCCFLFFLLLLHSLFAQEKPENAEIRDSVPKSKRIAVGPDRNLPGKKDKEKNVITDYKIISYDRDTTYFDTTLTIQKEYKYNYLRKDDFELLPFSNLGQTYNTLAPQFNTGSIYPGIGVKAKHFNYMETAAINYYHVPTPITDLFFKTAMEQGQLLDAFITLNTSKQFNLSIAYKGLRSLGKYRHIRSSTGNFRFTANYRSKRNNYRLRTHVVTQDILNQENGGIVDEGNFESGNTQFTDRSRITVQFENAENLLEGKRYYMDQELDLLRQNDSLTNRNIAVGHRFNYETKFYQFNQALESDYFGDAFQASNIRDRAKLRRLQNELYLAYRTKTLGELMLSALHYNYNYFFKSIVYTDDGVITNRLKGNEMALGGMWKHRIAGIDLSADLMVNVSGSLGGNAFHAGATYAIDSDKILEGKISIGKRMPDFNTLLYQSDYIAYNWQNTESFNPERIQQFQFRFQSQKWFTAGVDIAVLDNYTYFAQTSAGAGSQVQPFQHTSTLNYLKIRLEKEFKFGKFALNNTVMYQRANQDVAVINVPEWVTRNTLYFSDYLFKKALYLQTGLHIKYFSKYNANAYNPLLGEFYVQSQQEIGNFPLLDFFVNAKVRQTRIYVKAEHFNSAFTGYNFYSAPHYPYRDFIVRFGLVWNFFL